MIGGQSRASQERERERERERQRALARPEVAEGHLVGEPVDDGLPKAGC